MKILSNLEFDKNNGEAYWFYIPWRFNKKLCFFWKTNELASHVFVSFIRGLTTNFKFSFSYFATKDVISVSILPRFWEAAFILEKTCNFWVIASTSDGADTNRTFYRMDKDLDGNSQSEVCYWTIILYAKNRFIYFVSGPSHLVKTARNCLFHSGMENRLDICGIMGSTSCGNI